MSRYRCTICDYLYDPELSVSLRGLEAGAPFEELPADWVCPVCSEGKEVFEKLALGGGYEIGSDKTKCVSGRSARLEPQAF